MKALLQAGLTGRVPAPPEKRFLISLICLGAATDLAAYLEWLDGQSGKVLGEIAAAIRAAYGGTPAANPELYRRHSAVANARKLKMPLLFLHGGADRTIPVHQARALAAELDEQPHFTYREIPDGNHDSPLFAEFAIRSLT